MVRSLGAQAKTANTIMPTKVRNAIAMLMIPNGLGLATKSGIFTTPVKVITNPPT